MGKGKTGVNLNRIYVEGKRNVLFAIIGISILSLTGCESGNEADLAENSGSAYEIDLAENSPAENSPEESGLSVEETWIEDTIPLESQIATEEESLSEEAESEVESAPVIEVPQLPDTGRKLVDFVPEGWELLDSVELDFNQDGVSDYVGVLEIADQASPRILFAIASDGNDAYRLDFQNINLILSSNEGGAYGDPYLPLTADGTSFTTYAYGGSSWRGEDTNTYTYRDGEWWLTSSEYTFGYFEYTTVYRADDWVSGVGIRKERDFGWNMTEEEYTATEYDVVYELTLDEPLTLEQAGWRRAVAPDRVTDWGVADITFGAGVELSRELVRLPDEAHVDYCDEDRILYTFSDEGEDVYYFAMYSWQDKVLSVLAQEDAEMDDLEYYRGKIYYTTAIGENLKCKTVKDGKEQIIQEDHIIEIRLNRMEMDGTGKETLYKYRYPGADLEIIDLTGSTVPNLYLNYEISGNEIVMQVHEGNETDPFYRMNIDGSGIREIGRLNNK